METVMAVVVGLTAEKDTEDQEIGRGVEAAAMEKRSPTSPSLRGRYRRVRGERILILAVATAVEGGACWWAEKDPKPVNTMVKASGVAEAGTVTIVRGCQALSC